MNSKQLQSGASKCKTITLFLSFLFLSLPHSLVLSFPRSLILSFSRSLVLSFSCSLVLSFSHSLVLSFSRSLVLSFSRSLVLSFSRSLVLSFSRSLILSFSRSLVLSFSHSLSLSLLLFPYTNTILCLSLPLFLPTASLPLTLPSSPLTLSLFLSPILYYQLTTISSSHTSSIQPQNKLQANLSTCNTHTIKHLHHFVTKNKNTSLEFISKKVNFLWNV
jgi:hypothetical protein